MDRINHVKIVTPDPGAIEDFLTQVLDIPKGWGLGDYPAPAGPVVGPARDADGSISTAGIMAWRGEGTGGGMIVGSPESRQFQIFAAKEPKIWAVAVGTRNIEQAHERCVARGIPATDLQLTPWGNDGGGIRFFFAEVGGIVFEVMRAEASGTE